MRELKAISQNLMHSSISITDGVYGNLNDEDMKATIASLKQDTDTMPEVQALLQLLRMLKSSPDFFKYCVSERKEIFIKQVLH